MSHPKNAVSEIHKVPYGQFRTIEKIRIALEGLREKFPFPNSAISPEGKFIEQQ